MKSLIIIFSLIYFCNIFAQWSNDPTINNPICIANNNQQWPQIVSDGKGGAIICWHDHRSGIYSDYSIYAQRINSNGTIMWPTEGRLICEHTVSVESFRIKMISDGSGGAIITWQDIRSDTNYDIYVQAIDSNGTVLWAKNGIPICDEIHSQRYPQITSDMNRGAIIAWEDWRLPTESNIYAQKINSDGLTQWATNGIPICTANLYQSSPKITSDLNGGAIIAWEDFRSGTFNDIYAQRINSEGLSLWTEDGVGICISTQEQYYQEIISDNGGAILTWMDFRNGFQEIYTQKIDSTGQVLWLLNGVPVCRNPSRGVSPQITSDGSGGAILAWQDYTNGTYDHIYGQKINVNGLPEWRTNGIPICTTSVNNYTPQLISYGNKGTFIVWSTGNIYGQRIDANGIIQWIKNGIPISTANDAQGYAQIVGDGNYGALITWQDYRNGNWDIYASRVDSSGKLGDPTSVRSDDVIKIPDDFKLGQNFPNPFNPYTIISWKSPKSCWQTLRIYNVIGDEIVTLVDEYRMVGNYEIYFDATDLSSGVYVYTLQAGSFFQSQKMLLLK
jgi:hypothetical protein